MKFPKRNKEQNEIINMGDTLNDGENVIEQAIDEKTQQQIAGAKTDESLDVMPSANSKGMDKGNAKRFKLAMGAVAGAVIILGGVGISLGKANKASQAEAQAQAQALADQQKQMAGQSSINLSAEQEEIANNEFHDLPPPTNDPVVGSPSQVEPPPFAETTASNNYAYPQPEEAEPQSYDFNPIKYENPPPKAEEPPPYQAQNGFGGFGKEEKNDEEDKEEKPPVVITPLRGSDSGVLIQVDRPQRVSVSDEMTDEQMQTRPENRGRLAGTLTPTVFADGTAGILSNANLLLTKGTTIPCVLKTKIDSTYQGFTVCQVSKDVYSTNGKTLLIEKGSKVFGEQNIQVQTGKARVQVLWTRIDTPKNVSINIDSPIAGQLGEMGVNAKVNNHYIKRFGGALMLSIIEDGLKVVFDNLREDNKKSSKDSDSDSKTATKTESTANSMANQLLQNTINMQPTAKVNQGAVVNILVARDVDFSTVYKLVKR